MANATVVSAPVVVNPDMTFTTGRLVERQTFALFTAPEGWVLKSVTREGKDITDAGYDFKPGEQVSGIEILLTRRVTVLNGTVHGDRGESIADYSVVAFSSDASRWGYLTRFVRSVRPDQDAKFTIRGLPPDEYFVVAIEYLESGQEFDPEQLRGWATRAIKVNLAEGSAQSVSLKLTR